MSHIKMEAGSGAGYVRLAGTHRALLQNDVDRATSLLNCKRTCIDKFMYIQARLASSNIICMHALHVITLKHCHIVAMHDLTSVAQLSVINKADIRSVLDKTLASERFRRNAVDDAP